MMGVACGAGNAYPSGAPDFTSGFHRGSCCPVICVLCLFILFHCLVITPTSNIHTILLAHLAEIFLEDFNCRTTVMISKKN